MLIIIRARVIVKQRNRPSSRTGQPAVSKARCSLGRLSAGTTTAELHVAGSILAYSAQTTHKQTDLVHTHFEAAAGGRRGTGGEKLGGSASASDTEDMPPPAGTRSCVRIWL